MFSLFRGRGAAWAQFERDLAEWERQVAAMEAEEAAAAYRDAPDECTLAGYWVLQVFALAVEVPLRLAYHRMVTADALVMAAGSSLSMAAALLSDAPIVVFPACYAKVRRPLPHWRVQPCKGPSRTVRRHKAPCNR